MEQKEHRLAAIMFTDIVGFSKMMEHNEAETLNLLAHHNELIKNLTIQYNGNVIKTIGDAFLVDFKNTIDAVRCAIQIHHDIEAYNTSSQNTPLRLRIGIHLGDIYFFDSDALGEGINIASRLESHAKPGRICISQEVYHQVVHKVDAKITELGEVNLKNITRTVVAYEIIPNLLYSDEDTRKPEASETEERQAMDKRNQEKPKSVEEMKQELLEKARKKRQEAQQQSTRTQTQAKQESELSQDEIKDFVLGEIRRVGKRINVAGLQKHISESKESSTEPLRKPLSILDDSLNKLVNKGFLNAERSQYNVYDAYDKYKAKTYTSHEKAREEFHAHLGSLIGVNGFLIFLWFITGASFPWWLFVLVPWLSFSTLGKLIKNKNIQDTIKDLEKVPDLPDAELGVFKKIQDSRSGLRSHIGSWAGVTATVVTINIITGGSFPWSLIVSAAMGMSVFFHVTSYFPKQTKLKKRFRDMLGKMNPRSRSRHTGDMSHYEEALSIEKNVRFQIENLSTADSHYAAEIEPVLDDYMTQLKGLEKRRLEIDEVLKDFPTVPMEKELLMLKAKKKRETDPYIMKDYDASIDEIQKQKDSLNQIITQKGKLLDQEKSAITTLRKLQMDFARIKTLSEGTSLTDTHALKEKADDLHQYLDDLEKSYKELD